MTATAGEAIVAETSRKRTCPYPGLEPYSEGDAAFFFGRDVWRSVVIDYLLAFRLSLFYGASGVGKSSILRAGVVHHLREQSRASLAETGTAEFAVVEFATWKGDAISAFEQSLATSVASLSPDIDPTPPEGTLAEVLSEWSRRLSGPDVRALILVVLDQFEEYFVYHGHDTGVTSFAAELVDALARRDVPANFLLSIREDALDKLDRLEPELGGVYEHLLRFEHLDRGAAREAIVGPVERWRKLTGEQVAVDPDLVEEVLDQVRAGRLRIGEGGRGTVEGPEPAADGLIEAPYLQLVMTRIWQEERRRGSDLLRLETLRRLGGAERIVQRHLTETMRALPRRERTIAARVFAYLVTPDERKIAVPAAALAKWAKRDEQRVTKVLRKLTSGERRILREVPSPGGGPMNYEIFHDRLARGVLDYAAAYRRRRRRLQGAVALALVLGAAAAALALLASQNASQAADLKTLTTAFGSENFKALLQGHRGAVTAVSFSPDGQRILTASNDGTARLWSTATGKSSSVLQTSGPISSAGFSPDGRTIVTAGDALRLWRGSAHPRLTQTLRSTHPPTAFSFSASGNISATNVEPGRLVTMNLLARRLSVWRRAGPVALDVARHSDPPGPFAAIVVAEADADGAVRIHTQMTSPPFGVHEPIARTTSRPLTHVAVSGDGHRIAATGADGRVFVWNRDGRRLETLRLPGPPASVDFSPDSRLVVASSVGHVRVWSAQSGRVLRTLGCGNDTVPVAFSPDGTLLAGGCSNGVHIWDARTWQAVGTLSGGSGPVTAVAFSPDGSFIVGGDEDGTARVWLTPGNAELVLGVPQIQITTGEARIVTASVEIVNAGVASARATTLAASAPGVPPASTQVAPLDPGVRTQVSVDVPLPPKLRGGSSILTLQLDPQHLVTETNRRNDVKQISFRVPPPSSGTHTVTVATTVSATTTSPPPTTAPEPTAPPSETVTLILVKTVAAPPVTVTAVPGK